MTAVHATHAASTHTYTAPRDSDSFPGSEALAAISKLEELRLDINRGGLTAIPDSFRVWSDTLTNLGVSDITSLTGKHYLCILVVPVYVARVVDISFDSVDRKCGAIVVKRSFFPIVSRARR